MSCYEENGRLYRRMGTELLCVEAWGADALRVRATRAAALTGENWALTEDVSAGSRAQSPWRTADHQREHHLRVNAEGCLPLQTPRSDAAFGIWRKPLNIHRYA
jgi:hypothetical protein